MSAEMRDRTRDGLCEITDTNWDHNGTLRVTVRELVGEPWSTKRLRAARDLARRALSGARTARTGRTWFAEGGSHATFYVSRLR